MEDRRGEIRRTEIRAKLECSDNPLATLISETLHAQKYYGDAAVVAVADAFHEAKLPEYLLDTEPDPSRRYYLQTPAAPRFLGAMVANVSGKRGDLLTRAYRGYLEGDSEGAVAILDRKRAVKESLPKIEDFLDKTAESAIRTLVRATTDGVHPYHIGEAILVPREKRMLMIKLGVEAASTGQTLEIVIREAYKAAQHDPAVAEKQFLVGVVSYLYESKSVGKFLRPNPELGEGAGETTMNRLCEMLPGEVVSSVHVNGVSCIRDLVAEVNEYYRCNPEYLDEILPRNLKLKNLSVEDTLFIQFDVIDRLADYYQSYFREELEIRRLAGETNIRMQEFWFGICGGEPSSKVRDFQTCADEIMERLVALDWKTVDLSTIGTFGAWIEEVGLDRRLAVLVARAVLDD